MSLSALFVLEKEACKLPVETENNGGDGSSAARTVSGRRGGILRYQPELRTESFLSRWDLTGFHGRGNDMGASIHSLRSKEKKKNEDEYLEF